MKKVLKKRTGFTLVELLIVIIIIGILAGAMLLVAGSGTDKAEATKIVSDLRSMKAASLLYYADHNEFAGSATDVDWTTSMDNYMDRDLDANIHKFYSLTNGTVWVGIVDANRIKGGVITKLADVALETGLFENTTSGDQYDSGSAVYMRVK